MKIITTVIGSLGRSSLYNTAVLLIVVLNRTCQLEAEVRHTVYVLFFAVLGIRIRMFLGLQDPDPLVRASEVRIWLRILPLR
jgi:hypothetical protein